LQRKSLRTPTPFDSNKSKRGQRQLRLISPPLLRKNLSSKRTVVEVEDTEKREAKREIESEVDGEMTMLLLLPLKPREGEGDLLQEYSTRRTMMSLTTTNWILTTKPFLLACLWTTSFLRFPGP
jgi:hypothetical protein